ncbi:outer membrane lipoprotein chaperone LolA [Pelomicrobium sp.]|mgnify:CR=1 FL=1|jgi:outer membrane lipoprotein carrier protein|uniref:outer membrane lipoprotein chaperone LolA n=1 Tax=Pelomicrobium sp. TaxID=2815319 RepID=UPI002FDDE34C
MVSRFIRGLVGSVIALLPFFVWAGGLEKLDRFVASTAAARADFQQTVRDAKGTPVQQARGTMEFQRPGRFRWAYVQPYEQLLVGDGEKLWIYDRDLKQVTVRGLGEALGATPAALLAGSNDLRTSFHLKEGGKGQGLEWVEAIPKARETPFQRIRLGFDPAGTLVAMELEDGLGQTTALQFFNLQRNPAIDPARFRFTPPPGTDVIGEGS